MKPIVLTEQTWMKIRYQLIQTHPKSVMLTRWKMREVLGFTDRLHTDWVNGVNKWGGIGFERREIHLDFFDEVKRTFFLLKYGDYIDSKDSINK